MDQRPLLPSDGLKKDPYGAHEPPIYQTSTFVFDRAADAAAAFAGETAGYVYTRINNPTVAAWERKLAALESAGTGIEAWALAYGSGMGAATAAILACVKQGDHVVGVRPLVDNTFATPVLQQPLALGADLVVQSSTKYLGGHGTVVGGGVIARDKAFVAGPLLGIRKVFGSVPSPFDTWLLLQGVKTLELRVERATTTAAKIVAVLAKHPKVAWIRYPGLPSDPGHEVAKKQMKGFGAMIAFGIRGGTEAGRRFMDALQVAKRAVSLGCTDTLIEHPASMTHAHLSPEELTEAGITADLIRVSVGLEDADELEGDLLRALDVAAAGVTVAAGR